MDARRETDPAPTKNRTTTERKSDRELVVKRTFNAPARIVFEAWTKPELFKRWWVPKSMGVSLHSCELDVRTTSSFLRPLEVRSGPSHREPFHICGIRASSSASSTPRSPDSP